MKTTVILFFEIQWHDLGFLGKILIFLGFLGKINCQDLGKKFKIIQDYSRSWQENQKAKHWAMLKKRLVRKKENIL